MAQRGDPSLSDRSRLSRALFHRRGAPSASESDVPSAAAMAARLAPEEPAWPPDALAVRQWLWGEGFHIPGNAEYVRAFVAPLAPRPAMRLLEVGAGLGGAARLVAGESGASVAALERDPELARRGRQMSAAAGLLKRAPVYLTDPETLELRVGEFAGIFGREATHMVADKERFLRVLIDSLEPRGLLLLTEIVVAEPAIEARARAAWAAFQPFRVRLWSLGQYVDCLRGLGVELLAADDITAQYKGQIVGGWDNLLRTIDLRALPRAHRRAVVDEAERWVKTIAALDNGGLRLYRFHARAGA